MGNRYTKNPRPWRDCFWEKVDVRGEDDCWPWKAGKNSAGYGKMKVAGQTRYATHCLFKIRTGNWVPVGKMITHKECHNPPCCNPKHFRLGTNQTNANDMVRDRRQYHPTGKRNSMVKLTNVKVRKIKRLLAQGLTQEKIGQRFGVVRSNISQIRMGETWTHITGIERGPKRPCGSKLSDENVYEIKRLLIQGELSQREIGERLGVSESTINHINTGRTWAHMTEDVRRRHAKARESE